MLFRSACGADATGTPVVELIAHRTGLSWLLDVVPKIYKQNGSRPIALLPAAPVAALEDELRRAGVQTQRVDGTSYAQACAGFEADVREGRILHRGQEDLTTAALAARRRIAGDVWRWSRRDSSIDISPLIAATLARHLHISAPSIGGIW